MASVSMLLPRANKQPSLFDRGKYMWYNDTIINKKWSVKNGNAIT